MKFKNRTKYSRFVAWVHDGFFVWLKRDSNDAKILYGIAGLVFVAAIGLAYTLFFPKNFSDEILENVVEQIEEEREVDEECEFRRKLDGICVESEEAVTDPMFAVMIENNIEARPLSGVSKARVVYEAPVEGHITRFMALYDFETEVSKVGPVRSARPYYLDWLQEYGVPMYMHVGGSPDGLEKIKRDNIFDMNEFFRGWYFWRSEDRYAPHNIYTSSKLWKKAYEEYGNGFVPSSAEATAWQGENENNWEGWNFAKREPCGEEAYCVKQIDIDFNAPTYAPRWMFNTTTEQYERYELGKPHLDRETGDQIAVDTLIVQNVDAKVLDNVGRLGIDTIGEGDGVVFRNGYAISAHWYKGAKDERTIWEDVDGHRISFQAGKIWVSMVTQHGVVEYKELGIVN